MGQRLYEMLDEYSGRDVVPMHMPGHKRNPVFEMKNPYALDVTEVTGMDNLHRPEGVIRRLMERVSGLYGSEQSYLLVNGSTGGILSAIAACCRHGDRIIAARNCHASVYRAIRLLELRPVYIYPECEGRAMERLDIAGAIPEQALEEALKNNRDVSCVIVTSPTYEGIVSDIRAAAALTRRFGVPLIVDEAHGAHFNWHPSFPETALEQGADLVVESLHKTLPALTQTGVLHARFDLVSKKRLEWCLQTFQSSSPSYILMAGIDRCFAYIEKEGGKAFDKYVENLRLFREKMKQLTYLYLFESPRKESSKLVIATDRTQMTGRELAGRLLQKYRIETEMSYGNYCIAMTSVCDEPQGFHRLAAALLEIDGQLAGEGTAAGAGSSAGMCLPAGTECRASVWQAPVRSMYSYEAADCCNEWVSLSDAEGRIAAEDVYFYPPGVPLLVQGEIFSKSLIRLLEAGRESGYVIHGVEDETVSVVEESEKRDEVSGWESYLL